MTTSRELNKKLRNELKSAQVFAKALYLQHEEDKKQISRELHDEIAQILTSVNLQLAVLSKEASKTEQFIQDTIKETQVLIIESIETIHQFALELRPKVLDDLGLIAAIKSKIQKFRSNNNILLDFHYCTGLDRLNEVTKVVLYRVAQEALINISKHSKATEVSITISKFKNMIKMEIHDNGVSFKVKRNHFSFKPQRLGLVGIEERIRMLDGISHIESSPKKGTTIMVQVPIRGKRIEKK